MINIACLDNKTVVYRYNMLWHTLLDCSKSFFRMKIAQKASSQKDLCKHSRLRHSSFLIHFILFCKERMIVSGIIQCLKVHTYNIYRIKRCFSAFELFMTDKMKISCVWTSNRRNIFSTFVSKQKTSRIWWWHGTKQ